MEVSGQPHHRANSPPPPVPIEYEPSWAPQPVWTFWKKTTNLLIVSGDAGDRSAARTIPVGITLLREPLGAHRGVAEGFIPLIHALGGTQIQTFQTNLLPSFFKDALPL